jgi:hypothetical protein
MNQLDQRTARYRCFIRRNLDIADTGVLPFVQLRARDAERAAQLAQAVTGCLSVVEVLRLEQAA